MASAAVIGIDISERFIEFARKAPAPTRGAVAWVPISYYEQIYRVMGWPFDASSSARTSYIGKLTNRLIYDQMPPGIAEELRKKNPTDPVTKRRKKKHFSLLTEEIGEPHLDRQLAAVITLLRATPAGQWKFFEMLFNQAFPPMQRDLFIEQEILQLSAPQ